VSDDFSSKVTDLKARRQKNLAMGGKEKIAKQHERGKLTVRERIDLLFDKDTFVEFGLLASQQAVRGGEPDTDGTPADGVVTGHGEVEGREVWVIAYDFTVMAGSMGAVGEQFKAARVRELARREGKQIRFVTAGEETEIDKAVVERVAEPLLHLVRNAVAHGIEPPEVRRAFGKPPLWACVTTGLKPEAVTPPHVCGSVASTDPSRSNWGA